MNREKWALFLLGIVAMVLLSQYAMTQDCTPGYSAGSASIGDIQSSCHEQYPAPQNRTDVGIGELVDCWIDPTTWQGTAIYTTDVESCTHTTVSDSLGAITWSVSGQGSVYPIIAITTTLTVYLADEDNVITVYATAIDNLFVDPPVQKQKAFNAKVPTGANCYYDSDVAIGVLGPPNDWIGGRTDFNIQVLPANVNFKAVLFRENVPLNTWVWEDGTDTDSFGPKVVTYTVKNNAANPPTPNWSLDKSKIGFYRIERLAGVSETIVWNLPQEYQDENGAWKQFLAETHEFDFNGATGTCTITENCTNSASGNPQGPWR